MRRRTPADFPQRVSRLAAARAPTRAARRCSKPPTRVFGRACAWADVEWVPSASIAAERSAGELRPDSTAAPTLGHEASRCPGLLREEVDELLAMSSTTEASARAGRASSLSCCSSSCSPPSPRRQVAQHPPAETSGLGALMGGDRHPVQGRSTPGIRPARRALQRAAPAS